MVLTSSNSEPKLKERLIATVKKEVKILMEEAVTKKFIHEESSSVIQLCAAVEACLSHGLRRRALGLFKTSSTTALLQKIGKTCPDAESISKRIQEMEAIDPGKRTTSSSSDSTNRGTLFLTKGGSSNSVTTMSGPSQSVMPPTIKYLWIRLALFEKRLVKIIEHLAANASAYYDRDALVSDPDYGSILSSLLIGPCALEYSRAKTSNHYWSDPHADELVQRHRIGTGRRSSSTCSRSIINFKRSLTSSDDSTGGTFRSISTSSVAKDYVESLHQNSGAALLYGKNNVQVFSKDAAEPMAGYLSLHQHIQSLIIKWTPNQLMNVYDESEDTDKSEYWAYALNINVDDIVYVHCHQKRGEDSGGTVILVGQDGVQRPPIHFPEGGHMQTFLSHLETGLLPHGQLDPPLWSQRGIGKIFPWPKNVRRRILSSVMESPDDASIDYVFRIVSKSQHEEFVAAHSILDFVKSSPKRTQLGSCSTTGSSDFSSKSVSIDQGPLESPQIAAHQSASIELVCTSMRRQIISRSFYGWLAYCRHLSTVRTHLSGLVNGRITPEMKADENGLTQDRWNQLQLNGTISNEVEVYRLVYFGGCQSEIRKEVWPYLLGYYNFGMKPEERASFDETSKHYYETTMSEWLAVEAIVQEREKETTHNINPNAKTPNETNFIDDIDNEVFETNDFSDMSDPEDIEIEKHKFEATTSNSNLLTKPVPRTKKTSTDSGNVDEDDIDENGPHEVENGDGRKTKEGTSMNVGINSSPSSSSYETVANECIELTDAHPLIVSAAKRDAASPDIITNESEMPVFYSIDDFEERLPETGELFYEQEQMKNVPATVIVTDASIDAGNLECNLVTDSVEEFDARSKDILPEPKSICVSPASSIGGIYSPDFLKIFKTNLDGIEKDVHRCDRNYWYFANDNLEKLRNVITTYVWEHLDVGYMQGMCDLVAPLLVIFDDESKSYGCFCKLMDRMIENFPKGGAMDMHFANMRSLIQILDSEMYEMMDSQGDYTHLYFCYRWFLLDFKREFIYDDVFATWEVIWAAKHVASSHFVLFLALALLETYRDVILSNSMNFTDVIKFFNEMAERHNCQTVLQLARSLVLQLQMIIENK